MISIIGAGAKSIKNILKKLESPLGINKAESTAVINKIINIFFFETIKSFKIKPDVFYTSLFKIPFSQKY